MALVESFSGIRGIYGKGITDDIGVRYAYAFSSFLREKKKIIKVVIGRDTRVSGENLRLALIEGMDCDIIDAGVNSTPAIENAVREYKADGGIIITASHNEPEYNGFKFLGSDGAVLRPNEMAIIIEKFHSVKDMDEAEFLENLYKDNKMEHVKRVEKRENDALDRYKKFVLGFLDKKDKALIKNSGVKIVIDANGGAGVISKEIFDELGIDVVYLNMNKGIFKRKIEPNEGSLRYLVKVIKENKAEFAAGFDCDADRVEIILENGKLVSGNDILALIVDEILSGVKDASKETVVVNDATSYIVKEIVSKHKGKW
ncbi:MAG: hypothetical protein KAQ85_11750, partial [Thermodesulfovibrionia bacterium]|nr:hypothetical protein [Thermodesulfovibrionia bacterium]